MDLRGSFMQHQRKIRHGILGILLMAALSCTQAANLKFVIVVYDVVTHAPVSGKQVDFSLENLLTQQPTYQQLLTTGAQGEILTPTFNLTDSVWYRYTLQTYDCQNQQVTKEDSLYLIGSDTLFLYFGICHSVVPGICTASFSSTPDTANPLVIQFHDQSTGNPTQYHWSFGDGTHSSLQNPVKHYAGPGSYLVCLTVSDTTVNCQHTWCDVIQITQGIIIQAGFTAVLDSFHLTPRRMVFDNVTESNLPLNYRLWSFGDGMYAQILNPVHHYQHSGQYQVCLTTGIAGSIYDTVCHIVEIPGFYNLWGQLFAFNTTYDNGLVQLIKPEYRDEGFPVLHDVAVDTLGIYYFVQRVKHSYLLRAFPDEHHPLADQLLPTYSGNKIYWKEASSIELDTDMANYDISLQRIDAPLSPGPCIVEGTVWYTFQNPVPGALVLLLHAGNRTPAAYTFADTSGTYRFTDLPYGSYILLAEVPGKETSEHYLDLSPNNPQLDQQDILLDVMSGIDSKPHQQDVTIYPNPASDMVWVRWSGALVNGTVTLTDQQGRRVISETLPSTTGAKGERIDVSGLPGGVYILSVYSSTGNAHMQLIKR